MADTEEKQETKKEFSGGHGYGYFDPSDFAKGGKLAGAEAGEAGAKRAHAHKAE